MTNKFCLSCYSNNTRWVFKPNSWKCKECNYTTDGFDHLTFEPRRIRYCECGVKAITFDTLYGEWECLNCGDTELALREEMAQKQKFEHS